MDLGRIYQLQENLLNENLSTSEIADIQEAFDRLVESGAELRDAPENATVGDQLDELQEHVSKVEEAIYEWVLDNFGATEAAEPSWSTFELAKAINNITVIGDTGRLGDLLNETEY